MSKTQTKSDRDSQAQVIRIITLLSEMRSRHPATITTRACLRVLALGGHDLCLRSVQRMMLCLKKTGLVDVEKDVCPPKWFLTNQGKDFLGVVGAPAKEVSL